MSKISAYADAGQVLSAGDFVPGNRGTGAGATKKFSPDELRGVLDQSAVASAHTGDLVESTLATINLPAGAMGANGKIVVTVDFSYTNSGNVKTLKVKLGGTTLWSGTPTTTAGLQVELVIRNRNAQNSQRWSARHFLSSGGVGVTSGTAAIDTSSATTITITGQLANAGETITVEGRDVVLTPKS